MPYTIDWMDDGVYTKHIGILSFDDNVKFVGELYADPRYDSIKFQISDLLEADMSHYDEKAAQRIGKLDEVSTKWNPHMKVAHLATDPETIRIVKSYEESMKDSGWEFEIFENFEDAIKWARSSN
jgi:hypothetical protein